MVEKKVKAESAQKAFAPKVSAPEQPSAKSAQTEENPAAFGTVTLMQTGSPIGRQGYQRATLIGLGLNKMNRTRTLEDTPSVRGMIAKVKHLVKVVE